MKPAKTALLAGLLAVLAACGSGPEAAPPQTVGGLTSCVVGPPGSLDLCFGVRGKVITDRSGVENYLDSIAVQPDGMIVGVVRDIKYVTVFSGLGRVRLVRYYPDGTLDNSFDIQILQSDNIVELKDK